MASSRFVLVITSDRHGFTAITLAPVDDNQSPPPHRHAGKSRDRA